MISEDLNTVFVVTYNSQEWDSHFVLLISQPYPLPLRTGDRGRGKISNWDWA